MCIAMALNPKVCQMATRIPKHCKHGRQSSLPLNRPMAKAYLATRPNHIIYGDLGTACAFTLCPVCTCNLTCDASSCAKNHSAGLVTEGGLYSTGEGFGGAGSVDGGGEATMILHTGDFGALPLSSHLRLRACSWLMCFLALRSVQYGRR